MMTRRGPSNFTSFRVHKIDDAIIVTKYDAILALSAIPLVSQSSTFYKYNFACIPWKFKRFLHSIQFNSTIQVLHVPSVFSSLF